MECLDQQPFQVLISLSPQAATPSPHLQPTLQQTLDSDNGEHDIDALLDAATKAMSRGRTAVLATQVKTAPAKKLIQTRNGVAQLNPDVLLAQSEKQAEASATEKVCSNFIERSRSRGRDDENHLCVASSTGSS